MSKVISIYEAKTHLSKLVKRAEAGEVIYIGAYGNSQAILAPVPIKKPIKIGVWADKKITNAYKIKDLVDPDPDITADFEESIKQPLP